MSVLIALPCYGGNVSEKTTTGLFNLGKRLYENGIDHGLLTLSNESLISRGRSRIVNFFMNNTQYDYLFFIDSDIGFAPADFFELWKYRDLNMVSGAYPMKSLPLQYNYNLVQPVDVIRDNVAQISGIGLGFSLISRKVFLSVIDKFPELKYTPSKTGSTKQLTDKEIQNSYHFFVERKIGETYLPEDHSFFSRARDCGYKSWLCGSISLSHTGYYVFEEEQRR
jgi:cellulose synthase/poly-beta-1,6-N-acetylglucosamine synthase-like glycosyltransferase